MDNRHPAQGKHDAWLLKKELGNVLSQDQRTCKKKRKKKKGGGGGGGRKKEAMTVYETRCGILTARGTSWTLGKSREKKGNHVFVLKRRALAAETVDVKTWAPRLCMSHPRFMSTRRNSVLDVSMWGMTWPGILGSKWTKKLAIGTDCSATVCAAVNTVSRSSTC